MGRPQVIALATAAACFAAQSSTSKVTPPEMITNVGTASASPRTEHLGPSQSRTSTSWLATYAASTSRRPMISYVPRASRRRRIGGPYAADSSHHAASHFENH
jgi:hypothetical protein